MHLSDRTPGLYAASPEVRLPHREEASVQRMAFLLIGLCVALAVCAEVPAPSESSSSPAQGWTRIAAGPLSARYGAAATWVDGRFVVVGGFTDAACPPNASCTEPAAPARRDGAAFDPATDRWTRIAAAPRSVELSESAAVGDSLFFSTRDDGTGSGEHLLRYRADTDAWAELPTPPGGPGRLVAAGNRLVSIAFASTDDERADSILDLASGEWSRLPADPLGASEQREAVWDDGTLILFGKQAEADDQRVRTASLDVESGTWTPTRTLPLVGGGALLVDGLVVFPIPGANREGTPREQPYGGILDPATGAWSTLPELPAKDGFRVLTRSISVGDAVVTNGYLLDPRARTLTRLPDFPGTATLSPAAEGHDGTLLIWGGSGPKERNVADGYLLRMPA